MISNIPWKSYKGDKYLTSWNEEERIKKKKKKKKDFWSRGSNYAKRPKALFAASIAPFKFALRFDKGTLRKSFIYTRNFFP